MWLKIQISDLMYRRNLVGERIMFLCSKRFSIVLNGGRYFALITLIEKDNNY